MKILITGICGFAGSSLARFWLENDPRVTIVGVDNFARPGSEINRGRLRELGIRLFHGDVRMPSDLEALPPVDWVIDAAANPSVLAGIDGRTSSRQLVEHNLLGTLNVLEYCRCHGAGLILLSSSRVYSIAGLSSLPVEVVGDAYRLITASSIQPGLSRAGVSEQFSTAAPLSLYGASKLASETMALEYGETFGFPVRINRCGILAGAGQFGRVDQGLFSYWINSWLHRRPLAYIGFEGAGHQVRDCLHPRDLAALLIKQTASGADVAERICNLGGGLANSMSLAGLSDWCAHRFGGHEVGSISGERRFDVPWLVMDSSRAADLWGWRPEMKIHEILEEIALHAERHPQWLELSGQA